MTVIIPTKNRAQDLQETIESLLRQTVLPTEIVLVDQSPQKSFTRTISISTQYIHNPSLSGLTMARNAAAEVAKGDVWLFLDDDVILEPSFIEEILAAYKPDVTGVSGIITNYERPPLAQHLWETAFVRGPFFDDRQRVYWNARLLHHSSAIPVRQFGGGLMSFRAAAVRTLRFDTRLTGPCPGEDIEFCATLPKNAVLLIAPRARLVHKRSPAGRAGAHWLLLHAQVSHYMRERHWRRGFWNNLCFLWLNLGYVLAATAASARRLSLEPWRAWFAGRRKGICIAQRNPG